jgi:large subunit ribosomal protein L17
MHRHGYIGRKFHRQVGPRKALIKSLAEALIINGSIETTLPKAKELVRYVEPLITKAKKADLHNRRQILAKLQTVSSTHKLVDDIAPKLKGRNSGHLKIERTSLRRGDNTQMARVSFVDDLTKPIAAKETARTTKPAAPKKKQTAAAKEKK